VGRQEANKQVLAGTFGKGKFLQMQQMYGVNWNADGLLACKELRRHIDVVECFTYDWMHTLLQDGVFTVEVFLMLKACNIGYHVLESFLKDPRWQFPMASRAKAKRLHSVFNSHASNNEANKLKCSASEAIGLYGLLRHYIEVYVAKDAVTDAHRTSWEAACKMVGLLLAAKHEVSSCAVIAPRLQEAAAAHLQAHLLAHGPDKIRPKHHWGMDLAAQLLRDNMVVDAFVIERMHLRVKAVAEKVKNTSRFERSVLSGVLTDHMRVLNETSHLHGLLGSCASLPDYPGLVIADSLVVSSFKVNRIVNIIFVAGRPS
jgi:hypothetical protein